VLRATYPWIVATQTIPVIVLAPILVVWFGFGIGPKLAIVALVCFFPITVNVLDGLRSVDPEAIKLMRTLYASRWQRFRRLEAPSALPGFFTGAKIAVVIAPIGAIFGEWVGADAGLGHQILQDNAQLEIARVFGAVAVLAVIGVALFGLLALAERRVVTWR
jgi:ABC-type nitrate/sulfonate/bicarbonate transport system permease component